MSLIKCSETTYNRGYFGAVHTDIKFHQVRNLNLEKKGDAGKEILDEKGNIVLKLIVHDWETLPNYLCPTDYWIDEDFLKKIYWYPLGEDLGGDYHELKDQGKNEEAKAIYDKIVKERKDKGYDNYTP